MPDEEDIATGTSSDCNSNGLPDDCEDCNNNGLADACDLDAGAADCNGNGVPDECEADCDSDGLADECETDTDGDTVPDDCDQCPGGDDRVDCQPNSMPDACDIWGGSSADCNANGVPDECEPDCNASGTPDDCDVAAGTSSDCNGNSIPDECEPDEDCNGNGSQDICDITAGVSNDCNGNDVPDECEIDCNDNSIPDGCDLADQTSPDGNGNGIPDECDVEYCLDGLLSPWDRPYRDNAFGWSIGVNGDVAVIGAGRDDDMCPDGTDCYAGAAYVFRLESGSWVEEAKLTAPDTANTTFGWSAAAGTDVVLIGTPFTDDACPEDPECNSGAVYIFRRQDDTWIQEARLTAPDGAGEGWWFGSAVAISGDVAVIGASEAARSVGRAYVYRYAGGAWNLEMVLQPQDGRPLAFGTAVAIDGARIVVGAPDSDDGCAPGGSCQAGSAYVFGYDHSTQSWTQEARLNAAVPLTSEHFGSSVAIDGDVIAIGGRESHDVGKGCAYVFRFDVAAEEWVQEVRLVAADGQPDDHFGDSVALEGNTLLVGLGNDGAPRVAYLFQRILGQWYQVARLGAPDEAPVGWYGSAVALDGGTAFVGARDSSVVVTYPTAADDCNKNRVADYCDLSTGTSEDCDDNSVPDDCQIFQDCNNNSLADFCDIASGTSRDCNDNGVPDDCDLVSGTSPDCNANSLPDECDVASGFSRDCNGNGVPDECTVVCTDDCECNDFSPCTWDVCVEGACGHTASPYGDVNGSGVVNLIDILGTLDEMAGANGGSTMHFYDIEPCEGDGVVNLFDVFAVLGAIAGNDPCGCEP